MNALPAELQAIRERVTHLEGFLADANSKLNTEIQVGLRARQERDVLRESMIRARNDLAGVGPDSSKEFHGIGIASALEILDAALGSQP